MPLPQTASLADGLKVLKKYTLKGPLAYENPFYGKPVKPAGAARRAADADQVLTQFFDACGLSVMRGRLFLEEALSDDEVDELLIGVLVALGRRWADLRQLQDVWDALETARPATTYPPLDQVTYDKMRPDEAKKDEVVLKGKPGQLDEGDCIRGELALEQTFGLLGWSSAAHVLDFAASATVKARTKNNPHLKAKQLLGRIFALSIGRLSVLTDPARATQNLPTGERSQRETQIKTTHDRLLDWLRDGKVSVKDEANGVKVSMSPSTLYIQRALPVKGKNAVPDTRQRYERLFARVCDAVDPNTQSLREQHALMTTTDEKKKEELHEAIDTRSRRHGLPGSGKGILAEGRKLAAMWKSEARSAKKDLGPTLTLSEELQLCRALRDLKVDPDYITDRVISKNIDYLKERVGRSAAVIRERLMNPRAYSPVDTATLLSPILTPVASDAEGHPVNLDSSGPELDTDPEQPAYRDVTPVDDIVYEWADERLSKRKRDETDCSGDELNLSDAEFAATPPGQASNHNTQYCGDGDTTGMNVDMDVGTDLDSDEGYVAEAEDAWEAVDALGW